MLGSVKFHTYVAPFHRFFTTPKMLYNYNYSSHGQTCEEETQPSTPHQSIPRGAYRPHSCHVMVIHSALETIWNAHIPVVLTAWPQYTYMRLIFIHRIQFQVRFHLRNENNCYTNYKYRYYGTSEMGFNRC